ncbi:hypothetical protein ACISU4_17595 [Streptomyces wuyuanensis]|uniref:hypothetical protein n=1 Tax=Streptomyces wuyuanensis TaxID=1196353 RepID=UPI00381B2970
MHSRCALGEFGVPRAALVTAVERVHGRVLAAVRLNTREDSAGSLRAAGRPAETELSTGKMQALASGA